MIQVIIEMKCRNPRYGYRRIAMQIAHAFGISIDKVVVRRVLSQHYKNNPHGTGFCRKKSESRLKLLPSRARVAII